MTAATPDLAFEPRGLFIGGEWVSAHSGHTITSVNPANGELLGAVPLADEHDVDRAVAAAKAAFPAWAALPVTRRAEYLRRLAAAVERNADYLALMDAVDSGNAISGMRGDMTWTADALRYFAGLVTEMKGETMSREQGHLNLTLRQPYGVVARINPFNHPFRFCAEKAAAALAAGNTVVIKGPEQAPLSSLKLGELCADIFPPGVVNIVTGDGGTGSAMVRHRDVARIGFVGSVETGRIIAREAAESLKEVTLELGGKNPIVIFPDADPAKAAAQAVAAMNMNRQGQSCSSTSRVLVHRSLHQRVSAELVKAAAAIPIGLPWLEDAEMGPIVSRPQYERVLGYVASGRDEGAKLLTGGGSSTCSGARCGLLHRAHRVRPRAARDAHRQRGDLRSGDGDHELVRLRRDDRGRQRRDVRPDGLDRDQRLRRGDARRRAVAGGLRVDQLLGPLPRRTLRRLEAERHRQGGVVRGAAELHPRQEHQHALVATGSYMKSEPHGGAIEESPRSLRDMDDHENGAWRQCTVAAIFGPV